MTTRISIGQTSRGRNWESRCRGESTESNMFIVIPEKSLLSHPGLLDYFPRQRIRDKTALQSELFPDIFDYHGPNPEVIEQGTLDETAAYIADTITGLVEKENILFPKLPFFMQGPYSMKTTKSAFLLP